MELKACSSSKIQKCCGRENAKDARDRISEMPDAILGHILSSIPTRDSVGTSTLSKRWRDIWTSVPVVEIEDISLSNEYHKYRRRQGGSIMDYSFEFWFMDFVDRVLLPSLSLKDEVSCVRKLRLNCLCDYDYDLLRVRKWIKVVNRLNDLEELDLNFSGEQCIKLPPSTFTNKKLMILKLTRDIVLNLPPSVCLPKLKKLHLVSMRTLDVDSVKKFVTSCPVLEELHIERCGGDKMENKTLQIQSSSLKSLAFYSGGFNHSARLLKLVIDATNLERLDLIVDGKNQVEVNSSLSSLVTMKLDVRNRISQSLGMDVINALELLMKMPNTKYLYLSAGAMKYLEVRGVDYLPTFKNLMHLQVGTFYNSWPILPCLLESSPNLTHFSLFKFEFSGCLEPHQQCRTPKCLMLYLEKIELHICGEYEFEMEIVSYFLKIAPALKKMSITVGTPEEVSNLHGKALKLLMASATCEIEVLG